MLGFPKHMFGINLRFWHNQPLGGFLLMKYGRSIIIAAIIGLLLWCIDAAFVTYYTDGVSFGGALYSAVPLARVVIRLLVVLVLILAAGIRSYMQYNADRRRLGIWMEKMPEKEELARRAQRSSQKNHAKQTNSNNKRQPRSTRLDSDGDTLSLNNLDNSSEAKSDRLWQYAGKLATAIRLKEHEQAQVRILCYAYDVGRIAVVQNATNLSVDYTNTAREDVEEAHAELGARIAEHIPELAKAANLIRHHHERWDGSGYLGLAGLEIPLGCRVFSIAWVFDALTSYNINNRNYSHDEALEMLYHYGGTALDPELTGVFIKIMSKGRMQLLGQNESVAWQ